MLCRFLCRDGASLNNWRPLYELPRGKGAGPDAATGDAPTAKGPGKPVAGAAYSRFSCRDGACPNKRCPLCELPCGKASAGNAAWLDAEMGDAATAKKPAWPVVGAASCRCICRVGASLNKMRPLYKLPRGKASACKVIRLPAERGSASIKLGRRRAPPLPTLASSEQPSARGLRQFRPQARSGASESTFDPFQTTSVSGKKKNSRSTG